MSGLVQKFKEMLTPPEDEFDYEYEEDSFEDLSKKNEQKSSQTRASAQNNKVVNIHATAQLQVVLFKPERFGEDTRAIADELIKMHTVVLNLENTNKDVSRRSIDFLSGVAYANGGQIKKVATSTFIITPYNVGLTGDDLLDELENSGVYFQQQVFCSFGGVFMLTVNDIRDVKFRKTNIGGYKAEDVDNFLDEVQDSYEKLQKENLSLTQKIKILADRVSQYRKDEDSVKDALVGAQKLANSELAKAKAEAMEIIEKAQKEADSILKNANSDIKNQKETLANLKKAVREFRSDILSRYKEHLKLVNSFNAEDRLPLNFNDKNIEKSEEHASINSENTKVFNSVEYNSDLENHLEPENEVNDDYTSKFYDLKFGEDYDVSKDTK